MGVFMSAITSLGDLKTALREFAEERDWEQFHTPKNLAMALTVETAELLEHFQWLTPEQSENPDSLKLREISHELGDILIYLVRLADRLDIDLLGAASEKLGINRDKYPADQVRGQAKKYKEYESD